MLCFLGNVTKLTVVEIPGKESLFRSPCGVSLMCCCGSLCRIWCSFWCYCTRQILLVKFSCFLRTHTHLVRVKGHLTDMLMQLLPYSLMNANS